MVGGYTCCHGHGPFDSSSVINQHLNGKESAFPTGPAWPNYNLLKNQDIVFDKLCNSVHSYDVRYTYIYHLKLKIESYHLTNQTFFSYRSQYPAAALEPNPVGPPLIINTLLSSSGPIDLSQKKLIDIKSFCSEVQSTTNQTLIAQKINGREILFKREYYCIRIFLRYMLPKKAEIVRISSSTHCSGQISVGNFFLDLHVTYKINDSYTVVLMNYNSHYNHGCETTCAINMHEKFSSKRLETEKNMKKIQAIAKLWVSKAKKWKLIAKKADLDIRVLELTDCDFAHRDLLTLTLPEDLLLSDQDFLRKNRYMPYETYLKHIYQKQLQGFVGKQKFRQAKITYF